MKILLGLVMASGLLTRAWGASDDVKFPVSFDKLGERATESVDVTLDASMLQLASGFLSKEDQEEVQVKKLISKLKGVYVRSFTFDKDGQYSMADVEALKSQLKPPAWSRIVGVTSTKGENTGIFLHKEGNSIAGLVVIAAEPRELTVVHIDGPINPEELSELGGHMGIPRLDKSISGKKPKEEE
jgi:hypothetical protein